MYTKVFKPKLVPEFQNTQRPISRKILRPLVSLRMEEIMDVNAVTKLKSITRLMTFLETSLKTPTTGSKMHVPVYFL